MVYLDTAATSDPNPEEVILADANANPGRGAHQRAVAAARVVY